MVTLLFNLNSHPLYFIQHKICWDLWLTTFDISNKKKPIIFGDVNKNCQQTALLNSRHYGMVKFLKYKISIPSYTGASIILVVATCVLPLLFVFYKYQPIELIEYNAKFDLQLFLLRTIHFLYTCVNDL